MYRHVFFSDLPQNGATIDVNLPIVDMLYNGHLVIADTFLRNWLNHGQTLIEKPLYSRHFYSGYLPITDFFLSTA